ncbi:hypothetical protein BC937DRAFT_93282 [Endogone sp. FLAS-F59071]|nr:hypothetical protein BC937DRAFT_93282 [Endogone sp. FLAS-F59071]|eukprot:RUS21227.1 hypothetical protein BC937DRAFT_93282 [Endogone sp. FLAS-F59071]
MPLISDVSEKVKKADPEKARKAPEKARKADPEKAKKIDPEKAKKAGPKKEKPGNIKKPGNAKKHQEEELKKEDPNLAKMPKYQRGQPVRVRNIKDRKLKGNIKKQERKFHDAAYKAASSELLLTEEAGYLEAEGMERTYKFTQEQLIQNLDINSANKSFDLKLNDFGPYSLNYTRNGRHMLIGGRKGHVATFDWHTKKLGCELHLKETVRDVQWLHNQTMFAVAQKKYVYIYDRSGLEVHCLRKHVNINRLEFLPYHFLLASVGAGGWLKYQDTSTGQLITELRTKLGNCAVMTQNPYNAIIHLGHANGTVTLWSPNMSTPLVKMLTHRGPVQAMAVGHTGQYMATSGLDGQLKVWDVRTYKLLQEYYTPTPAGALSISQLGLLAVGWGPHVTVWKDAFKTKQNSPYMTHLQPSTTVHDLQFCPYDDVLGFGHSAGISSLVIPGSGEPNFDSLEANPFQTKKQRQESEVHSLLDKIQPEMITLDPNFVGKVDRTNKEVLEKEARETAREAANKSETVDVTKRARGKNSSLRRYLRKKQKNVIDQQKLDIQARIEKGKEEREKRKHDEMDKPFSALDRFTMKKPKLM